MKNFDSAQTKLTWKIIVWTAFHADFNGHGENIWYNIWWHAARSSKKKITRTKLFDILFAKNSYFANAFRARANKASFISECLFRIFFIRNEQRIWTHKRENLTISILINYSMWKINFFTLLWLEKIYYYRNNSGFLKIFFICENNRF